MNTAAVLLIDSAAKGAVLAALGALLYLALRRGGPASGAWSALSALAGMMAVSLIALLPLPEWWNWRGIQAQGSAFLEPLETWASRPQRESTENGQDALGAGENILRPEVSRLPPNRDGQDTQALGEATESLQAQSNLGAEFPEIQGESSLAGSVPTNRGRLSHHLPLIVACLLLASIALGIGRLLLGLRGVAAVRRRGRALDDIALLDLLDELRAELSCQRSVAIFETEALATPAASGGRHPALLLPVDWRTWTEAERRAVLAHELAHIARRDDLACLWAQIGVSLHFFNPLAHWLAARLRLEQELAADARAAKLVGGRSSYLDSLARLALRRAERPTAWPVRPFLPIRGTLVRRIEMLRDSKTFSDAPTSPLLRILSVGILATAAVLIAGFRGPSAPGAVIAQDTPAAEQNEAPAEIDLRYIPREADLVVALRVAELMDNPDWKPLIEKFSDETITGKNVLVLPIEQIEQVTYLWLRATDSGLGAILLKAREPQMWEELIKGFEGPHAGFLPIDDRTIILGPQDNIEAIRVDLRRAQPPRAWEGVLESIEPGQLVVLAESSWFIRQMHMPARDDPFSGALSPLFDKAYAYALSVDIRDGLALEGAAACSDDQGAEQVAETLGALRTLARNALQSFGQQDGFPNDFRPTMDQIVEHGETLLDTVEVTAEGRMVRLRSSADVKVADVLQLLLPAVASSRAAASRAQSMNNLKHIALALHNYENVHGHLPPPVLMGPDGKTPYSWRVALLPYMEQVALYDQYRFDEPWDGPNNSKLAEVVLPVYNVPNSGTNPSHTDYFVLTGPETLFSAEGKGTRFADVWDGLSNTIAVVEAKRSIPWTKPEDIPYDPQGPLPELGGFSQEGYNAALADGSVRFISKAVDEPTLRALITKAGGEVIRLPEN